MYKDMRRSSRAIGQDEIMETIRAAEFGVLSTAGEDGIPYGTPINFTYDNGVMYFHCASEGHKLDNIRYNDSACFTVVDSVELMASSFTTQYRSVIVFGKVYIVEDVEEKHKAMVSIIEKFSPDFVEKGLMHIEKAFDRVTVLRMDIEHMTGKAHKSEK